MLNFYKTSAQMLIKYLVPITVPDIIEYNCMIYTIGGGAGFFPGSSAGSISTYSSYI